MQPVFRNPDKFQLLQFREWIRQHLPNGSNGVVVEDLDLVVRVYGSNYKSDSIGKFMLIELKYANKWIGIAQEKTFNLIHTLLRKADPNKERYMGYYIINYDNEDWEVANFRINANDITRDTFEDFLKFKHDIGGLWD